MQIAKRRFLNLQNAPSPNRCRLHLDNYIGCLKKNFNKLLKEEVRVAIAQRA